MKTVHNISQTTTEQRDHYIRTLLDGRVEIHLAEMRARQARLQLDWLIPPYVVAVVYTDLSPVRFADVDDTISRIKALVHTMIRSAGYSVYNVTNTENNVVCLVSSPKGILNQSSLDEMFVGIHGKTRVTFGLDGFVGIGNVIADPEQISASYADAREMLGYKFQFAARGVISATNVVQYQYAFAISSTNAFDRVIGCFMDANVGKLSIRLDELVSEVRNKSHVSNTSIKRTLAELLIHILHVASNWNQDVDGVLEGRDPYNWIMAQDETPIIRDWILQICTKLIEQRQSSNEKTELRIVVKAKEYIRCNLRKNNLSLQNISQTLGVTAPYLSQVFSDNTGEGISTYISRLRLSQACGLLTETNLKIDIIAIQIGFSSANYFSQVFRKAYGVSPSAYRKNSKSRD